MATSCYNRFIASENKTVGTDGKRGFGPDREAVWRAFAQEIGAVYHPGDFWETERLEATVGGFGVVLDLTFREIAGGQVAGTRLRARYHSPNNLRLVIEDANVFPEPKADDKAEDAPLLPVPMDGVVQTAFRIRSDSPETAASILADASLLWTCLRREPHLILEVLPDLEKGGSVFLLTCFVINPLARAERLLSLLEIASETLSVLGAVRDTG